MTGTLRREPVAAVLGVLGLVASLVVAISSGDVPPQRDQATLGVVAAFALAIVLGEWFHLAAPGFRGAAPIGMAAAFGLVLTTQMPAGVQLPYGAAFVLAVTAASMALGTTVRVVAGRETSIVETTGRFVAILVATLSIALSIGRCQNLYGVHMSYQRHATL